MIPYISNVGDQIKVVSQTDSNAVEPYLSAFEGYLRGNSRYYWLDRQSQLLVTPPDESDGRWQAVFDFLYGDPDDRADCEPVDAFEANVFRDLDEQTPEDTGGDLESIGAWSVKYRTDYYGPNPDGTARLNPIYEQVSEFLRVGDIPWAAGIDNAGHYDISAQLLRCYLRFRHSNPRVAGLAWQFLVKRALYEAGQVVNHKTGSWRYEKSSGPYVGDFLPADKVTWSHSFPSGLMLFAHLTGQLLDVAAKVALHIKHTFDDPVLRRYQATYETGHYGPRRCAWYLRALRCAGAILGEAVTEDNDAAGTCLRSVRQWFSDPYMAKWIRQVQAESTHRPQGAWDTWLWLGEALPWCLMDGDIEMVHQLGSIARWMSQWNSEAGQVPYTIHIHAEDNVTPRYTSSTHTAVALPVMAGLVFAGQLEQQTFARSFRYWLGTVPYGCRGNVSSSNPKERDLRYGAGAPKIMATHGLALTNPVFDLAKHLNLI